MKSSAKSTPGGADTRVAFLKRLKAMGKMDAGQRNAVVCALIGHSRIQGQCFGYYHCGRCEAQVGDTLGGSYSAEKVVVIGHNCKTCRANYKECGWKDKLYAPDPFAKVKS